MSRSPFVWCLVGLLTIVAGGGSAPASVIVNGEFSTPGIPPDPFAGWTTFPDLGDPPTDGGGFALFDVTDLGDARQLEQTFTLPAGALTLSFEIRLKTEVDGNETVGAAPDRFQATLYDLDGNGDPENPLFPSAFGFFAFYSIDSSGASPEFYNPTFVSLTSLADGWRRVTLNLSSLPSQDLLLDFFQSGSDDGLRSEVALDNVLITLQTQPAAVPEPATLATWATIALLGLCWARRRPLRRRL